MGGTAQKRLVRKRDLERALSEIEAHPLPNAYLEQYTTPSNVAAETLYLAAYVYGDIVGKTVVELGCGTGRLAIGAALLGAKEVFGVDVDRVAVRVAQKNAEMMDVKERANWIVADIDVVKGSFDTVLQNPPFGVQRRRADRRFISKSLELSSTIYSFHKGGESNRQFIKRFIEGHGGKVTNIFPLKMEIPWMFKFHTKKKRSIQVDLYRIEGKSS
ncbi:MAG TPA: methyltransferase domain-containing protein, partial [Candidatus Bathyarchaeota archaeon]|nr:methyltransferase domain-containing protein [Candidatus Bathyarchaeota archaeon]